MANWLHKTTLEYRQSSDPPLADQVNWIRNPALPAGVSSWSDVVVEAGAVRAPNAGELATRSAADLAAAQAARMAEIDRKSLSLLEAGLLVAAGKTISTSSNAQANLQDMMIGAPSGLTTFPQDVSTIDDGAYTVANSADLVRIAGLWRDRKKSILDAGRALRAQVKSAVSVAAVNAISDARS